jgi:hypothetical protein
VLLLLYHVQAKYMPAQLDSMQEEARKRTEEELTAMEAEAQMVAKMQREEQVGGSNTYAILSRIYQVGFSGAVGLQIRFKDTCG